MSENHDSGGLDVGDLDPDPMMAFASWYEAAAAVVNQHDAVVLATADADGNPSARAVLLRGYDDRGFVFFTNYGSRKGNELVTNPRAALCFLWVAQQRQIRIEGSVERTDPAESDAYWRSRPPGAQLAATVSDQSRVVASRRLLDEAFADLEANGPRTLARPTDWGGFRLQPDVIEFWQGRLHRLHDRLRYRRDHERWVVERLAP